MRITGGESKGRRIKTLKGLRLRPTSAKVREALFNILGERVIAARVLDLFAGCGTLGLEALSRGAKMAVFIEHWRPAARAIRENAEKLGFLPCVKIMNADWYKGLRNLRKEGIIFDIILADPPYSFFLRQGEKGKRGGGNLLFQLSKCGTLAPDGIFGLEHFAGVKNLGAPSGWSIIQQSQYGQTRLSIFRKSNIG